MSRHYKAAVEAAKELSNIPGINGIILYGSVARSEEKPSSDVDLAIIMDDVLKTIPLDQIEGFPLETMESIKNLSREIGTKFGLEISPNPFWQSQYEEGINFPINERYPQTNMLEKEGIKLYSEISI